MKAVKSLLIVAFLALLIPACASDPAKLVEKTLEAREAALKNKDIDAYVALFHPEYQYQEGETKSVRDKTLERWAAHDRILLRTSNRRITFEDEGRVARVVQEFELQTEKNGKVFRTSGTEQFLLKRSKTLFKDVYLFYKGLGV